MAKKQHQIDFIMNAALNSGFQNTLSKAQTSFSQLGKEIQALNHLRSDISSFQKQQSAVQNTTAKLTNLQKQEAQLKIQLEAARNTAERSASAFAKLESESGKVGQQNEQVKAKLDAARQAMERDASAAAGLEREHLKLEQQIKNTSLTLERQNGRLSDTKNRLQAAGIGTDQLAQKDAELSAKLQELHAKQTQATDSASRFQTTASEAFAAVGQALAAAGITIGLQEIVGAYRDCIALSGDFSAAMSTVEALSGASASQLTALSTEAKELGASTVFTAQQSADAMKYMAMAGWDANEMLAGTSGMLDLAAASGEDLSLVSDMVTDNLTAFGMTAADTAHFADVLAQTAAKSNTGVGIMGETFKRSAPIAGALGYRLEDVAAAVGLMANAGIKGSIAGTALLNIFNGLTEGATLSSAALGEYEFTAVRADGSMKGFMDTITELREQFALMTEAEKVQNAKVIAGMRGYSGLLDLLNATDESYQSLYYDINNCTGAAERMAKIKLDNLNGDVALLNSAWEAVRMTIGEQLTPVMRKATKGLTAFTTGFNNLLSEGTAIVPMFTGLTAGIATFIGVITTVNTVAPLATTAIQMLTTALSENPYLAAAAGIAALVTGAAAFAMTVQDTVPSVGDLTTVVDDANAALSDASATLDDTTNAAAATAAVAEQYMTRLEELERTTSRTDAENEEYHNTLVLLSELIPDVAEKIDLQNDSINGGAAALRNQIDAWKKNAQEQAKQDYLKESYKQYNNLLVERAQRSVELTKAEAEAGAVEEKRQGILQRMNEISKGAADGNAALQSEYAQLEQSLFQVNEEQRDAARYMENLQTSIGEYDGALADMEAEIGAAATAFDELNGSISEQDNSLQSVFSQLDALRDRYDKVYQEASKSFSEQFSLFDQAALDAEATVEKVQQALDTQQSYWESYSANVQVLRDTTAESLNVTEEDYQALLSQIQSGTPEAVGLVDSIVKNLQSGNAQAVTKLVETLATVQTKRQEAADQTALWSTNMNQAMDNVVKNMQNAVDKMDLSDESRKNAQNTINQYIAKVQSMEGDVRRAYERLAEAAQQGLNSRALSMPGMQTITGYNAYATGGILSRPHIGLVAEDGPEAIIPLSGKRRKRGADLWRQVGQMMGLLPHKETKKYHNAAFPLSAVNPVAPQIQRQFSEKTITNFFPLEQNTQKTIAGLLPLEQNAQNPVTDYFTQDKQDGVSPAFTQMPAINISNDMASLEKLLQITPSVFLDTKSPIPQVFNQSKSLTSAILPTTISPPSSFMAEDATDSTVITSMFPQIMQVMENTKKPPRLADFPKIAAQTRQPYQSSLFDNEDASETNTVKNGGSVVISPQIVLQFQGGTTREAITEIQAFAEGKLRKIVQDELQEACNRTLRGLY